jgi:ribosomal protein S17E
MGRIKSLPIKKTTLELIEKYPSLFSDDFEKNKVVINKIVEADKKTRNSIAGYITRIVKRTNKK